MASGLPGASVLPAGVRLAPGTGGRLAALAAAALLVSWLSLVSLLSDLVPPPQGAGAEQWIPPR